MPALHQIAHLAHVEIRTPVPEKSLDFFTRYLGLTENGSAGDSVFLRAWDDYENVTIKLTAHTTSGVGRTNLRAASPEALASSVSKIDTGVWPDGDPGYGPTYVFTDPDGHEFGLYYESKWYEPPASVRPALKNQAQAYPGRGVSVRRLDHINGSWTTFTNKGYDAVYTRDRTGTAGQAWGLQTIASFHTHGTPPIIGEPA
jgi:catechol 2,3-dioxygenase-like lactoylglutathione lyase family enzyme